MMRFSAKKLLTTLFLSVVASLFISLPSMASSYTGWVSNLYHSFASSTTLRVEVGQNFYISDHFGYMAPSKDRITYGPDLNMTFSSSKPSVASVGKKTGLVKPKATGSTTITAKFKGKSYKATIKVLKKGSLGSATTYATVNKCAEDVAQYYNKKITTKNVLKIMKAYTKYKSACAKQDVYFSKWGQIYSNDNQTNVSIVVPMSFRADEVDYALVNYIGNKEKSAVKSVSATDGGSTLTIKFSKKLTKLQIQMFSFYNTGSISSTKASIPVDVTKGSSYTFVGDGTATLKPGKKSVSVTIKSSRGKVKFHSGKTYRVSFGAETYKFKVK